MINRVRNRKGGYKNGVANTVKYQLKTNPTEEDDSFESSIPMIDGEDAGDYARRVERVFEAARVPNQKNLYQHNTLSFHPKESDSLSNKQLIEIAKEFYLAEGLQNKNRHYVFTVERDTAHAHVHAAIHLTDLDSKRVHNKFVNYNPIAEKLENKYGLYNEHRKPSPFNEAPRKDKKSEFKADLNKIKDSALTASEFLILAGQGGYDILHNGNQAFSFQKGEDIFKASDLGMSYKALKKHFGEDLEFTATLASLNKKPAQNGPIGSIGGPQFQSHADHKLEEEKINRKSTLHTRFDAENDKYYFKDSSRKAFEYRNGCVTFETTSPLAIKAGLQKLTECSKGKKLNMTGSPEFLRQAWMQFHLMDLGKKGFTLDGYSPRASDLKELERKKKEQLERYKKTDHLEIKKNEADKKKTEADRKIEIAEKKIDEVEKKVIDIENKKTKLEVEDKKIEQFLKGKSGEEAEGSNNADKDKFESKGSNGKDKEKEKEKKQDERGENSSDSDEEKKRKESERVARKIQALFEVGDYAKYGEVAERKSEIKLMRDEVLQKKMQAEQMKLESDRAKKTLRPRPPQ